MYVDVFKQKSFVACVCRGGPAGVTAPAWPCVGERKQRICLNNVKKKEERRRGKQERVSQLLVSSHRGGGKHFTSKHMKEREERRGEEKEIKLDY